MLTSNVNIPLVVNDHFLLTYNINRSGSTKLTLYQYNVMRFNTRHNPSLGIPVLLKENSLSYMSETFKIKQMKDICMKQTDEQSYILLANLTSDTYINLDPTVTALLNTRLTTTFVLLTRR